MNKEIDAYNHAQSKNRKTICMRLAKEVEAGLPTSDCKIWHGSPVWFLDGNPIVGYDKLKDSIRLLFWSG